MLRQFTIPLIIGAISVWATGCEKSQDQRNRDVAEAHDDAVKKTTEVVQEANQKSAEAQQEANEKIAKEQQAAAEKIGKEQAKLDKTVAENNKDTETAVADLRKDLEARLTKLDKRLIDVRAKIKSATQTKTPRPQLTQSLEDQQAKSDSLRRAITDLKLTNETSLGSTKQSLEARLDQLSKSIDELERGVS